MKRIRQFIKETIDSMLTFKGGVLSNSDEYLEVTPEDRERALELFKNNFSCEYYYESTRYPEGVEIICNQSKKSYLVSYQGHVVERK